MPYKSDAQRKKFQQWLKEGKISQELYDEFEKANDWKRLPARAPKKTTKIRKVKVIK